MEDNKTPPAPTSRADKDGMTEAEIDRNLEGTFPASDPPSWTLGTEHTYASQDETSDKEKSE